VLDLAAIVKEERAGQSGPFLLGAMNTVEKAVSPDSLLK